GPPGNEPGKRILSPQLLGAVSVRNIRFRNPRHTPSGSTKGRQAGSTKGRQAGSTKGRQAGRGNERDRTLSLGGNGCRAPPAARRDAGSGERGKEWIALRLRTHTTPHLYHPLTPNPSPLGGEGKTPALPVNLPHPNKAPPQE